MRLLEDADKNGWTEADFSIMRVAVNLTPLLMGRTNCFSDQLSQRLIYCYHPSDVRPTQDKARAHAARVAMERHTAFQSIPWPARSPDLSSVENVRYMMGRKEVNIAYFYHDSMSDVMHHMRLLPPNFTFGPVNALQLDYFLWGYVKSLVSADKPQTFDHFGRQHSSCYCRYTATNVGKSHRKTRRPDWTTSEPAVAVICRNHIKMNVCKEVKLFTCTLKAFKCNNRIVMTQMKQLDDFYVVELLDDWNVDVPSWKNPRNLESSRVSSSGLGNDSKIMIM
ncbi:uncharacterized protein TNCV_1517161 [Trichonephila clavipes]|nr:uncharacterized protein TNCV_1517161 [Trichonephila clavipes]